MNRIKIETEIKPMPCIYCIENISNSKKYIGLTGNMVRRYSYVNSKFTATHHNYLLCDDLDIFDFKFYILEYITPHEYTTSELYDILSEREIYYIREFKTNCTKLYENNEYGHGYNLDDGGYYYDRKVIIYDRNTLTHLHTMSYMEASNHFSDVKSPISIAIHCKSNLKALRDYLLCYSDEPNDIPYLKSKINELESLRKSGTEKKYHIYDRNTFEHLYELNSRLYVSAYFNVPVRNLLSHVNGEQNIIKLKNYIICSEDEPLRDTDYLIGKKLKLDNIYQSGISKMVLLYSIDNFDLKFRFNSQSECKVHFGYNGDMINIITLKAKSDKFSKYIVCDNNEPNTHEYLSEKRNKILNKKTKLQIKMDIYDSDPKLCESCGTPIEFSKRNMNNYCNKACYINKRFK